MEEKEYHPLLGLRVLRVREKTYISWEDCREKKNVLRVSKALISIEKKNEENGML